MTLGTFQLLLVSAHQAVTDAPSHSFLIYGSFLDGDRISVSENMGGAHALHAFTLTQQRETVQQVN